MTRPISLFMILTLPALALASFAVRAQKEGTFEQFYSEFQSAVKADDKERVASKINFDRFHWETSEQLRRVRTRQAFLANYESMFDRAIKDRIARSKPKKDDYGNYSMTWRISGFRYSLYFGQDRNGTYIFEGLTAGPY